MDDEAAFIEQTRRRLKQKYGVDALERYRVKSCATRAVSAVPTGAAAGSGWLLIQRGDLPAHVSTVPAQAAPQAPIPTYAPPALAPAPVVPQPRYSPAELAELGAMLTQAAMQPARVGPFDDMPLPPAYGTRG